MKALFRRSEKFASFALVFVTMFLMSSFALSFVWDVISRNLYDCTDDCGFDYIIPGQWVHALPDRPIAAVKVVVHGRSMSEPDTVLEGWSLGRLWILWLTVFTSSIFASALFSAVVVKAKIRDIFQPT